MTLKQQLGKLKCKNFLFLTIAGMVNAFGVTMFIAPVDLYDSGISGTSILLSQLTPEWLSLSFFLMVLNIPLFLYGLRKQGVVFTIYAIYTVVVYSFGAWLITDVLPVDVSIVSPLAGSDLLLCAIFGGLISGIAQGRAAVAGISLLAKRQSEFSKAMVSTTLVEIYALLSFLVSLLSVLAISRLG